MAVLPPDLAAGLRAYRMCAAVRRGSGARAVTARHSRRRGVPAVAPVTAALHQPAARLVRTSVWRAAAVLYAVCRGSGGAGAPGEEPQCCR